MNPDIAQLNRRMDELAEQLNTFKKMFENAAQYAPEIARSLTEVLSSPSDKASNSSLITINESGSATKEALAEPTGFIKIGDRDIPYY